MRSIIRFLVSRVLAISLLGLIVFLLILNYFVLEPFGLGGIRSNPIFILISALLVLSTLSCSLQRLFALAQDEGKAEKDAFRYERVFTRRVPGEQAEKLVERLGRKYRARSWLWLEQTVEEGESRTTTFSVRSQYGELTSVVFHIAIVATVFASLLVGTSFTGGEFVVGEGESLAASRENVTTLLGESAWAPSPFDGSELQLVRAVPKYYKGLEKVDFIADLKVNGVDKTVKVNKPLHLVNGDLILRRFGFAPRFQIWDAAGKKVLDSFIKLQVIDRTDFFTVEGTDLKITCKFFPDLVIVNGQSHTRTLLPRRPAFQIVVQKGSAVQYQGLLRKGEKVISDGFSIRFIDLRYWVVVALVREIGELWVEAFLFLLVISLAVRFLIPTSRVSIRVTESGDERTVEFGGRSQYFPFLFNEKLELLWNEAGKGI